jgi:hypothetical protein
MLSGNDIFHACWDEEEGFLLTNWTTLDRQENLLVADARSILRDPLNAGHWFSVSWYSQGCEQWVGLPDHCAGPNMMQAE